MSESHELGKKGEQMAANHLLQNGYIILARNFRAYNKAELDIVASKEGQVVFVEVKTRESNYMNHPAMMVHMRKQKQIIKAANGFIKAKEISLPWRFDIISIVHNNQGTTIEHFEDAFYPTV
jgi:putative endonuclease